MKLYTENEVRRIISYHRKRNIMADIIFKRGDRVYDERYGNGIIDYLENHIIVQFKMSQYITYDLKGYRHFPEEKQPALFKR